MLGSTFRPWGLLGWILERIPSQQWCVVGCLSTEDRCIPTIKIIKSNGSLNKPFFLKILDPPSRFKNEADKLLNERQQQLISLIGHSDFIECHKLFEPHYVLVESIDKFVADSNGNIIVDISSLPKRFFFPIIKLLLTKHRDRVNNLIATYTVPEEHCLGSLAEDPEAWAPVPLFGPQDPLGSNVEVLFIGVGFLPQNLPELIKEYKDMIIRLFFPFPPGPPGFQRSWEFVRKIEESFPLQLPDHKIERIFTYDVSDAFDYICNVTESGRKQAIFAPYGPKTISLAMCIYASLNNSAVYYTQPKAYNPRYCVGVKTMKGLPETYAYCLRLNGKDFYKL